MNTKHFLTAAILTTGLFFASLHADAQRQRNDRDRRDYNDNRNNGGNYGNRGHNRHYRQYPRARVIVPPVAICIPATRQARYHRRHVPCTPPVCYAPPRRMHNHRMHR